MGKVLLTIVLLLGGCVSQKPVPKVNLELREVGESLRVNYKIMVTKDEKSSFPVSNKVLMTGESIEKASFAKNDSGTYDVTVFLNKSGAEKFHALTKSLIGKKLAVILDGELLTAPEIMEAISGGTFQISGAFTKDEADKIARGLTPQK